MVQYIHLKRGSTSLFYDRGQVILRTTVRDKEIELSNNMTAYNELSIQITLDPEVVSQIIAAAFGHTPNERIQL